jgi:hypothetical protein
VSVSIFKKGVLGLDVRYDTHKHHLSFGGLELGLGRDLFPFFFCITSSLTCPLYSLHAAKGCGVEYIV